MSLPAAEHPLIVADAGPRMAWRPAWRPNRPAWPECDRERREMLYEAWGSGFLDHLLTPSQLQANNKMEAWNKRVTKNQALREDDPRKKVMGRTYVLDSSRRWGKSALLLKRA